MKPAGLTCRCEAFTVGPATSMCVVNAAAPVDALNAVNVRRAGAEGEAVTTWTREGDTVMPSTR